MQQPIDMQQLNIFTGGDSVEEKEILDLFKEQINVGLQELERSITDDDSEAWGKVMHKIKGSSLNLGANPLAATCETAGHQSPITSEDKEQYLCKIQNQLDDILIFVKER